METEAKQKQFKFEDLNNLFQKDSPVYVLWHADEQSECTECRNNEQTARTVVKEGVVQSLTVNFGSNDGYGVSTDVTYRIRVGKGNRRKQNADWFQAKSVFAGTPEGLVAAEISAKADEKARNGWKIGNAPRGFILTCPCCKRKYMYFSRMIITVAAVEALENCLKEECKGPRRSHSLRLAKQQDEEAVKKACEEDTERMRAVGQKKRDEYNAAHPAEYRLDCERDNPALTPERRAQLEADYKAERRANEATLTVNCVSGFVVKCHGSKEEALFFLKQFDHEGSSVLLRLNHEGTDWKDEEAYRMLQFVPAVSPAEETAEMESVQ